MSVVNPKCCFCERRLSRRDRQEVDRYAEADRVYQARMYRCRDVTACSDALEAEGLTRLDDPGLREGGALLVALWGKQ